MTGNKAKTAPAGGGDGAAFEDEMAVIRNDTAPQGPEEDPYALENIRLDADDAAGPRTKFVLNTVKVGRPDRQLFVRAHPNEDYRIDISAVKLKATGETFLLSKQIAAALDPKEITRTRLFLAIYLRDTVPFLWECVISDNEWHKSALSAVTCAMNNWCRVVPDQTSGGYQVQQAVDAQDEPLWPEMPFMDVFKVAFKEEKFIRSLDHPVLKGLRG